MGRHKEFDVDDALDAALRVFWLKGYEGSSFDDLTKASGVARPGLYAAFGNKADLFRRALDRYDSLYMGFANDALDEEKARDVVEELLQGLADLHTRYPANPGCMAVNAALACSNAVEPIRQEIIRRRADVERALCTRLERAREEGDLPHGTNCASVSALVMIVAQGMAVQAKAGASGAQLNEVVQQFMTTWPA